MRSLMFFVLFTFSTANAAEIMTLDNYVAKMKATNFGYQASDKTQTASRLESSQARLLTSPQFYANANSGRDKSPTMLPQSQGTNKTQSEIQAGFKMQTDFGLSGKAYVDQTETQIFGTDPNAFPADQTKLISQSYGIELQMPLLKNGFGRDVQLKEESILNSSAASSAYAQIDQIQLENKAFLTYLKVAKLQETINLQQTSFEQGKSLVAWAKERVNTKLLEEVDLSQAIASMQSRNLNLQASIISLAEAQKDFNALLNLELDKRLPKLQSLEELVPNKALTVSVPIIRRDVKALAKSIEGQRANLLVKNEDYKPELNIVGKAVGYTKQSNLNDSARCTSFEACSQLYIGVTFQLPLDFVATENSLSSTEFRIKSQEFDLENAKIDSLAGAKKLLQTSDLLRMQRELSKRLIESQKLRLSQERKRQLYGRASAFDIIRAEQDYVESQINLLSVIYSQAEVNANLKLFEVEK